MRTVFVLTHGLDIGSPVASALAGRGARVAWLSDSAHGDADPRVAHIVAGFSSRAGLEEAFAAAVARAGAPEQVIVSALAPAALEPANIASLSPDAWRASCGAPMKAVLYALQASHAHMAGRGGSIVVIGPSLSLAGAPALVPLCAAVEGQRGLVKSAARQWGRLGLTVNWVAAAPRALSPRFEGLPLPVKPDPVPVALGTPPELAGGIVPVLEFLGSAAGRAMTGATLVLDGGEWMVP